MGHNRVRIKFLILPAQNGIPFANAVANVAFNKDNKVRKTIGSWAPIYIERVALIGRHIWLILR
jgi:alpha-acetolactate decarboxylase